MRITEQLKKNQKISGSSIFTYLIFFSQIIFLFSLSYASEDLFEVTLWEKVYMVVTTLLNPFYIVVLGFPFIYFLNRILPKWVFNPIFFLMMGVASLYLIIDKIVFTQFKFHINSFVWKILMQPHAKEILGIGNKEIAYIVGLLLIGIGVSVLLFHFLNKTGLPRFIGKKTRGFSKKLVFITLFLSLLLVDKAIFAVLSFKHYTSMHEISTTVPFYIPVRMDRFIENKLGIKPEVAKAPTLKIAKSKLKYPLEPYAPARLEKRPPNFIWLMTDAFRADVLNQRVMPNLNSFADKYGMRYTNAHAGSNGTHQGLFSLFYGLPASYMSFFDKAQISPIFIESLLAQGYEIDFVAASDLAWFAADETIFFKVRDRITDKLDKSSYAGDLKVTKEALKIFEKNRKNPDKPFFLMVFYDSTHVPHFSAKGWDKFKPHETSPLFNPSNDDERLRGHNEYRNAANFVDSQMKFLIEKIEEYNLRKNSIIMITGDHASEKYEHGHWGHASAFTKEQTHVPLVLMYPGSKVGTDDKLVSHTDLSATFLELMGETFKPEYHTTGHSLLDKDFKHDYLITSGPANRVLFDRDYKIDYTPFEGVAYYKVTTADDDPIKNKDEIIQQYTPKILKMFEELGRFLK